MTPPPVGEAARDSSRQEETRAGPLHRDLPSSVTFGGLLDNLALAVPLVA
ncbi:MAG: hypothetical protein OXI95_06290 [bacterium]|nr:hypothetical protein [bacterium]